ncbi:MAG: tripartite tricarboxylate transporter TctB family protein [Burkholderiaceae bacterium]
MRLRNSRDFFAGSLFAVFGLSVFVYSQRYDVGTVDEMGPGYFPAMLGLLLTGLGVLIGLRSFALSAPVQGVRPPVWRPLLMVLGSVAAFAIALPVLGYPVALLLLVVGSALGGDEFSWPEVLLSYAVLVAVSYLVFIRGLGLPLPVLPEFIVR